ncbi:MAG: protein kinase [Gemmatimonadetes bacterium]|nr:protein kinase [Gemmatimonadota bacterium]
MATCSKCQTPFGDDAAHCPNCGAAAPTPVGVEAKTVPFMPGATPAANTVQDRLAQALGPNYQVRRVVGRGGFAEVYELWDRNLERRLAAKVLIPEVAATTGVVERFKHEARTVARLNHPGILSIHFVGDVDDLAFYVMPFVEGGSLQDLLDEGKLDPDRALDIAEPILDALGHAHDEDLVHRDIKPDNVMIEAKSGRALLVDFGIAKALDPAKASNMTQAGYTVGTPHYMSPEQALGDKIDRRSDLYSFGVMLFEMVTGEKLFSGNTAQEIVAAHVSDTPREAMDVDESVPVWLSDLIAKCVSKRAEDRFQHASEMLETIQDHRSGAAKHVGDLLGGEVVQGSGYEFDEMLQATLPSKKLKKETVPQSQPAVTEPLQPVAQIPTAEEESQTETSSREQAATAEIPGDTVDETAVGGEEEIAPDDDVKVDEDSAEEVSEEEEEEEELSSFQVKARQFEAEVAGRKIQEAKARKQKKIRLAVTIPVAIALLGTGGWYATKDGRLERVLSVWTSLGNTRLSGEIVEPGQASGPPTRYVTNSLVEPVQLLVNGEVNRILAPGTQAALPIEGRPISELSWRLMRPRQAGREMGQNMSFSLTNPVVSDSSQYFTIVGQEAGREIFAPLISNPTSRAMVVLINAGTPDETRCNCTVPAGARSMPVGYYSLLPNTTVRFYDARQPYGGIYGEVTSLVGRVNSLTGAVELTVPN